MEIQVVVPAYNEAKVINQVVTDLKGKVTKIIVVDDGSTDKTGEVASLAGAQVVQHFINRGQGAALQTGINFALKSGADIIVTFDADGQHQVDDIENVIKPLLLGEEDVVLGSRFLNTKSKIPISRKILLKLATYFTKIYTGLSITDTHNGFRALSRLAAEKIEIKQDGMAHASEIIEQIKKHQLRFREVPVTIKYTEYSLQKGQKFSNSFKIIWDLILGRISR
ncbi:MAG: cell wall biosynthesis glycosyltransferase [Parcubacteria group bacterium]|nr:cell wall biosynthesis glycosyltransferase [Parcubacteria group bacterium]|tara:strand:- start:1148 stop:1819 length:672 start_codon:yes stop_codon:yes gene_type:complete